MRNHARFQQSIKLDSILSVIKGYVSLSGNYAKESMKKNIAYFSILKYFDV